MTNRIPRPVQILALMGSVLIASAGPGGTSAPASSRPATSRPAQTRPVARPAAALTDPSADELRRLRERAIASTQGGPSRPVDLPADIQGMRPAVQNSAAGRINPASHPAAPRAGAGPTPNLRKGPIAPVPPPASPTHVNLTPNPANKPIGAIGAPKRPLQTAAAAPTKPVASAPTSIPASQPVFAGKDPLRPYSFNYFNTPWTDVLDDFSRISGLTIVGDVKSLTGELTYRCPHAFTYEGWLYQLNELLLARPTNKMLLQREENQLELGRLADLIRNIKPGDMFNTVHEFLAANLPDHRMSLVVYTPPKGWTPIDVIEQFRPKFEDYYGTQVWGDSIVLTGMARDHRRFFEVVGRFVQMNPQPPSNEQPWRTIMLKNSKSADVQNILRQIYPATPLSTPRPGQDPDAVAAKQINIVADLRNNSLIIRAAPLKLAEIEKVVQDLDGSARPPESQTEIVKLDNVGADEAANALRQISQSDQRQFANQSTYYSNEEIESKRWDIYPQTGGSNLIIVAGREGMKRAKQLIHALDVPETASSRQRIVLKHAQAAEAVQVLTQVFSRSGRGAATPSVVFSADVNGNAVILSGREQAVKDAKELLSQLDQEALETDHDHLVRVDRASPMELANALIQLSNQQGGRAGTRGGPKFIGNDNSGYLIVRCDDASWPRYEKLVKELDGQSIDDTPTMFTYQLKKADAEQVAGILTPMFAAGPLKRGRAPISVRITADPRDNSIRVWAPREVLDRIKPVIAQLDIPSDSARVQVVKLKNAEAEEVVPILMQTFGGGSSAGRGGGGPATAAVRITAEPVTNSVLISAPKSEYTQIEALLKEMDAGAADKKGMRLAVAVKSRPAYEVAETLRSVVGPAGAPGKPGIAPSHALKIIASGDQIILDGQRPDVMDTLKLLETIDVVASGRTVKRYTVNDAEQAAEALRVLMSGTATTGRPSGGGAEGGARVQAMAGTTQIYPDTYNNVLIVTAEPRDIPQIDLLVTAIEKEIEPGPGETTRVGEWHTFKLKYRKALDISYDLEDLLSPTGKKGGPKFESGPDDKTLLVNCKPRQLPEVERLVQLYDVPDTSTPSGSGFAVISLKESTPENETVVELARQFEAKTGQAPNVKLSGVGTDIEIVDIHADSAGPTSAPSSPRGIQPCVLPASLMAAMSAGAIGQVKVDATQPAERKKEPLQIIPTGDGRVIIKGEPDEIEIARSLLNDILNEPPSSKLKIFPIKYAPDVVQVAQTLDAIFNERATISPQPGQAPGQPNAPAPGGAGRQGGPGGAGPQAPAGPTRGERRGGARGAQAAATGPQRIKVTAEARTRQLFIRAIPSDFPLIVAVLRTLDVETQTARNVRIFKLEKLSATPTAQSLREVLGLETRTGPQNAAAGGQGGRRFQVPGQQPTPEGQPPGQQGQPGQPPQPGQQGNVVATADTTTITAEEQTNTIVASGSPDTLKLIEKLITDWEGLPNEAQPTMKRVPLKFARASELVAVVRDLVQRGMAGGGPGGPGGGRGGRMGRGTDQTVSINADGRTNSIVLAGGTKEVERVEKMIGELDIDTGDKGQVQIVRVKGDPNASAAVLREMYAKSGPNAQSDVTITADATTGTLLIRAPQQTRAEIVSKLGELESTVAESAKRRIIHLSVADPDATARKLQEIFTEKSVKGAAATREPVKIIGVPSTKSIIVQAPDALFPEIEKHAKAMDERPADLDIRSFHLKHAKATEVSEKLTSLVAQVTAQMSKSGGSGLNIGLFAFTPDPATNSIIVTGSPATFLVMEKVLAAVDVEQSTTAPKIIALKNGNASQIAATLEKSFSGGSRSAADPAPTIVAESTTNSLIIRGNAADTKLIERMVADLDKRMTAEPGMVRIIAIPSGVDVAGIATTLEKTLNDAEANREKQFKDYHAERVTIGADMRANALVVAASKAKYDEVERLVQELIRIKPATGMRASFIPVHNASPDVIKRTIEEMQQKRKTGGRSDRTGRRDWRVRDSDDGEYDRNNSAAVGSSGAVVADIQGTRGKAAFSPRFAAVATALFSAAMAQAVPPRPADTPPPVAVPQPAPAAPGTATSQPGAMSTQLSGAPFSIQSGPGGIVFIGSEDDQKAIEEIVRLLDQGTPGQRIEHVTLKNAQAVTLAKSLQDVYTKMAERPSGQQQRPEDKVTFIADPRTNGVFIVAVESKMPEILALVKRSDTTSAIESKTFKPFVLKNRRVKEVEPNIKNLIQMWLRQKGITDTSQIGISRDDLTNTLFITAGEKDLEEIGKVIQQLDTAPPKEAEDTVVSFGKADIMLVPLHVATADKLATALSKLLQDAATGKTPTGDFIRRLRVLDDKGNPIAELNIDAPTFVVGDPESNSLIIASTRKNLLVLREIVRRFDVEPLRDAVDIRVRAMKFADVTETADQLKKMLDDSKKLTARAGKSDPLGGVPENGAGSLVYNAMISPDPRTNTLVYAGKPDTLTLIDNLLTKLDVPGQGVMPFEIIKLKYASATALEKMLEDLMKKRLDALPKGTGPNAGKTETVIVLGDPRAEALIIAARADRMQEVRRLIEKLDIPATALVDNIRPITLKNGNAADLATKITDLWSKRASQRETGGVKLEQPVLVADERSNSLIVAAAKGDFEAIQALVNKLEALPFGPISDIRIVALKFNSAKELGPALKRLFDERAKQRQGVDNKIRPTDMVAIETDTVTNSLLVACSPENFELLKQKVLELDVESAAAGVADVFTLHNVDATRAKKTLDDVFKDGLYRPGASGTDNALLKAREKVTVAIDDRSNSLIISASPENMGIVRKIVAQMDDVRTPWNLSNSRLFQLQHADAVKLAAQLQDYFQKTDTAQNTSGSQRVDLPVTIIADDRTNRLLVGGSRDGLARAESLIKQLDVPPEPSSTIQVYRLHDGSATKIGPMIETIFKERNQTRGSTGASVQSVPVTIKVDETSNALVISASREDHSLIHNLIALLDRPSNILEQVRLFALRKARADSIKKILEELYKSGATGGGGGGTSGSTGGATIGAVAVAVTTDPRTNSIVVAGPPGEMANIAKLVERLDSAVPIDEAEIGIFPLENADAKKTADLLKEMMTGNLSPGSSGTSSISSGTSSSSSREVGSMLISFASKDPRGQEAFFKTIRENVQVSYDERTNSVIVVAPPPSVALIKNLVKTLDSKKKREVYVRVFMLRNADAAKTVELLQKVFAQDSGAEQQKEFQQGREIKVEGGASGGEGVPKATGAGAEAAGTFGKPKTTFTSDVRTNSVVVAGWKEDIDVSADIIDQLDSQDIRDRINFVYALQNAKAEDVVTALDSYFQKETQRLGRQGEGMSEARKAEQEVSAVAHKESNQVILSFSPRYQSEVLNIVHQLDAPPPQVMIQVLLAEVTLDNRFELGMEFALQQLRFSETAVAGPNGTLKSNHFDVVGGTDLGAAASSGGLAGFSFTVTGEDFNFLVRALQGDSKLEVLQRPMIMCQDNQEASISVGQSVPFLRGTQVTDNGQVNSQIEYQDIGVKLNVTPHINPDGFVYMKVKPEISQITPSTINVGNGIVAPIFSKRDAETTVVVKDSETVIIGGLITTSDQETENKVPILGDLPGLGFLFRATVRTKTKTELLIVLTPRVVRTVEDARRLSVETRDVTSVLTDEQKQSPLMYGLQVKPETHAELGDEIEELGPTSAPADDNIPATPATTTAPANPQYGPSAPKYGPFRPVKPGDESDNVSTIWTSESARRALRLDAARSR